MANRASWNGGGRRADDRLGFCQVTMAVHTSPPDGRGRPRIGRLLACLLAADLPGATRAANAYSHPSIPPCEASCTPWISTVVMYRRA